MSHAESHTSDEPATAGQWYGVDERLREQNDVGVWATCPDRGLKHQWVRREVSPLATDRAHLLGRLDGFYTCHRTWCPAARFGRG